MATRTHHPGEPGLEYESGGHPNTADLMSASASTLFVRTSGEVEVGTLLSLDWTGPGQLQLETRVRRASPLAPDGRRGVLLDVRRVSSEEGAEVLNRFLRGWMGREAEAVLGGEEQIWWVGLVDDVAPPVRRPPRPVPASTPKPTIATAPAPARRGPPMKIAGLNASGPPLDTGLPPTTLDSLRAYFESTDRGRIGVYLNIPCAYSMAGAQYWGRALRLNARWLQVNSNSVIPGLGTRIRCDLTLDLEGVRRAVSINGIMTRRLNPQGGTYKGGLAVRIQGLDEGDSPGLLIRFLQAQAVEKDERDEA